MIAEENVTITTAGRIEALRLEPGDVLVVHFDHLSDAVARKMQQYLEETFPGHKAIVFTEAARLEVVRVKNGSG